MLEAACNKWSMPAGNVRKFFELSSRYEEAPSEQFYQVDCTISGVIEAEGGLWNFEINGGGVAKWSRDAELRYWGCSRVECEPLVLMLTDGMSGE